MKRDLLDAIGKIDPRYIEEAAAVQTKTEKTSIRTPEGVHAIPQERRRSGWTVAAAALFLVLSLGTAWMTLSRKAPGGITPSNTPADTPMGSGEPTLSATATPEDLQDPNADPGQNALDLDFDAVIAGTDSEEIIAACRYAQSLTPSAKNEMTGLFAGKNLILITAQNFSPEVIDPERTPTLYRLATQGIEFTDYYQPAWGSTASGVYASLTGLAPTNGVQSILDAVGKNMSLTLGDQLRRQGYSSTAYTDYFSYDYEHQNQTLPNLGYDELFGVGNGLDAMTNQWPYSDREMMRAVIDRIDGTKPFSVYCMTCSGIGLYDVRGNKMAEQHWSEVENLPYSDKVKGYLAANMEVEYALRDLVAALEEAGLADDTVIVLTSTQYPYALEENEDWGNTEDYLAELYGYAADDVFKRDHSSLIIWSGCLEGKDYQVTTPTSSLDIVPTLSNLFGLEYDSRLLVGRDVFSDQDPLVFWPDGSWRTDRACYNAATGEYAAVGSAEPYTDVMDLHDAVEQKTRFSKAVLEKDLYALLLPDGNETRDDPLRFTPGPDPCEVVREVLARLGEADYTISLTVEEVREDDAEKQKLFARDLSGAFARDGFGANLQALTELDPKNVTVVYARYRVELDHTKVPDLDGLLDQYFFLTLGEDGNWSIFTFNPTASAEPPVTETLDPSETAEAEPHFPPETSMEGD